MIEEQFARRHRELTERLGQLEPHLEGKPQNARSERGQAVTARNSLAVAHMMANCGSMGLAWQSLSMVERTLGSLVARLVAQHATRGARTLEAARAGHEATYGTPEEKKERLRQRVAAYHIALNRGLQKKAAKIEAATQCGVSVRAIERALENK